uniref:olfactory receptor 1F1 n=1 Tax=Panthera onca TaxID=9690 RepID=UPI002953A228|nr:olfactory receptor 1F1 [Panthera onca]
MRGANQSSVSEFLLLGLSRQPQQQQALFALFLSMYLATVLGNLLILLAISVDPRLHIPMYFLLSHLSFVDICFSTTTVPKMLANHILGTQAISFSGCLTQMYFVFMFVDMDNFLLAVMAYDRFVAICHPLHYSTKMTQQLCALLVAGSWVIANLDVLLISPFICILASYVHITCAVLRVPSTKGRWKAFSTCGSHLAVVSLFYGTIIAVYFNPLASHSAEADIASAVMFTVVTPMLNPFIYSLRNKDIKGALGKVVALNIFLPGNQMG